LSVSIINGRMAIKAARRAETSADRAAVKAAEAAIKVEAVRNAVAESDTQTAHKLADIKDVADKVHVLTNSSMTAALQSRAAALRANATSLQIIFTLTRLTADEDAAKVAEAAATEAENQFRSQMEKQKLVTAKVEG